MHAKAYSGRFGTSIATCLHERVHCNNKTSTEGDENNGTSQAARDRGKLTRRDIEGLCVSTYDSVQLSPRPWPSLDGCRRAVSDHSVLGEDGDGRDLQLASSCSCCYAHLATEKKQVCFQTSARPSKKQLCDAE